MPQGREKLELLRILDIRGYTINRRNTYKSHVLNSALSSIAFLTDSIVKIKFIAILAMIEKIMLRLDMKIYQRCMIINGYFRMLSCVEFRVVGF